MGRLSVELKTCSYEEVIFLQLRRWILLKHLFTTLKEKTYTRVKLRSYFTRIQRSPKFMYVNLVI